MSRFALRLLVTSAVVVMLMGAATIPASAHAELVSSDPPSGSVLERAPRVVTLWFGEALAPTLSAARLIDEDGNPVAGTRSTVGADEVTLTLDLPEIGGGRFSVLWQVLSADDGRSSGGAIVFAVGSAGAGVGGSVARR